MSELLTPRDWQAQAQRDAGELLGTHEGVEKLVEAERYGALADEIERLQSRLAEKEAQQPELSMSMFASKEDYLAALSAKRQKPTPVLLTGEVIDVVIDGYRFHDPKVRQSQIARAIEAAVLKKNGLL